MASTKSGLSWTQNYMMFWLESRFPCVANCWQSSFLFIFLFFPSSYAAALRPPSQAADAGGCDLSSWTQCQAVDMCHQLAVTTRVLTTCALTKVSKVSGINEKGLLQKSHDHMLWSKITTHYLHFVGTTAGTNLKTPHCFERLALFNKSFLDVRAHIPWWKHACALECCKKWPQFPYKIHPAQIPCPYKNIHLRFQLLRQVSLSCIHSVPFKNMYVGLTKRPWSRTEFGRLAKKEYGQRFGAHRSARAKRTHAKCTQAFWSVPVCSGFRPP